MVWARYAVSAGTGTCPLCDARLLETADMWGPVYACDHCGYEMDGLDSDGEPPRTERQLALPSDPSLIAIPGSVRRSTAWQASDAALGLPWAS
jgi:hypothetical protein